METKKKTRSDPKEKIEEELKDKNMNSVNDEKENDQEFIHPYILKKKKTILGKINLNSAPSGELLPVTLADVLIDEIAKNFFLRKLHHQILSKKYSKQGFNKKRQLFLKLFSKIRCVVKYHKYLYLTKLLDNMENCTEKGEIEINCDFDKIKIVCKNKNIEKENNNEKNDSKNEENDENEAKAETKNVINDANIEIKKQEKDKEEKVNKKNEIDNEDKKIEVINQNEKKEDKIIK